MGTQPWAELIETKDDRNVTYWQARHSWSLSPRGVGSRAANGAAAEASGNIAATHSIPLPCGHPLSSSLVFWCDNARGMTGSKHTSTERIETRV